MFATPFLDLPHLTQAGGAIHLPGSKSISNRVLLLSALCQGQTLVHDLLDSDDTRVMLVALKQLGCGVEHLHEAADPAAAKDIGAVASPGSSVRITGLGLADGRVQKPAAAIEFFIGNAGTAMRPLTAALAVMGGAFTLQGVARMHERPIGDLVDALRMLGCHVDYLGQDGYPPLQIGSPQLKLDAPIQVRGDVSSQFLTALLMALPLAAEKDILIEVMGELISKPYIEITLNLLARFGIQIERQGWERFVISAGSRYISPGEIHVEADASSASYFIALGALAGTEKPVRIQGVGAASIQGDIRFVQAAQQMGAVIESGPNWLEIQRGVWPLKSIDLDCNHIPDAAMTLAVMALYAEGTTVLTNIASWRVKETDRIAAMATELRKLGALVVESPDSIEITPPHSPEDWHSASIHTYDDHRVAMCFSLAAFNPARKSIRIEDPKCVAKTFPDYFETLFSVCQATPNSIPVICVDGPTASGKGTLAASLAQQLGYHFLDSGALYRITALAALQAGLALEPSHETAISNLVRTLDIRFEGEQVWLNGQDISAAIRTETAGMNASKVSVFGAVRSALLDLQHQFRQLPGLVADGRDMGTVIFPNAPLKVYLTASAACRAERRYKQLISKGISATLSTLCADLEARDARDTTRAIAPLKPAQDAQLLDNSSLTVDQSVTQVLDWWQSKQPF